MGQLVRLGLVLILIYSSINLSANPDYESKLYISYKHGKMVVWVDVMVNLKRDYQLNPTTANLYKLTQVQYGYIGFLIGSKDKRAAREYLNEAERNIEIIVKLEPQNADALAIKASLLAYHISLSPFKAPFLGPRSMTMIDEAYAINNNSAQALIEKGNAAHYAPSMFGGNPTEAVKHYQRAISLLEQANGGSAPKTWIYLNTLAQLGLAFEKANQPEGAQKTYNHILKIAPDFKWVKEELYPNFLKKN